MQALGNPGKFVGFMYDEKKRAWIPVEAAAGMGQDGQSSLLPWVALTAVVLTCLWLLRK